MKMRNFCTIVFIIISMPAISQNMVSGRVTDFTHDTLSYLPGTTIFNKSSSVSTTSGNSGYYSIMAQEGDSLIFTHTGFIGDTVVVQSQFFISGYDAALIEEATFLAGVTVFSAYRRDSIRRRQEYAYVFEKQPGITGGNTPQAGAGIVLSPISFFSKDAKQNRRLKKQLLKQEEEAYIDYVFSPNWVSSLTKLTGNDLQTFLNKYRPSYEFCRQHGNRTEMITYISDSFKEFNKTKSGQ